MQSLREQLSEDELLHHALILSDALDRKKALDVVCLDVRPLTPLNDFMIVASGTSFVQLRALSDEAEDAMGKLGYTRRNPRSNKPENPWLVLDFGFLVVHLFKEETRQFYSLEKLWREAPEVYRSRPEQSPHPLS